MKIVVSKIVGDATVFFYDENDNIIHSEPFFGKYLGDGYIRQVPVEKSCIHRVISVNSGLFEYNLVD